jgi:excisionase family DNA binding protein
VRGPMSREMFAIMRTTSASQLELDGLAAETEARSAKNISSGRDEAQPTAVSSTPENPSRNSAQTRGTGLPRVATDGNGLSMIEALLTFAEAARMLGISLRHFRRLVDGGKVGFVKVSERSPRVRPSELQRFLDASAIKYEVQS